MDITQASYCGTGLITYQGRLTSGSAAANGQYDLEFKFYDSAIGGSAREKIIATSNVAVLNGIFTVQLDVNSLFTNNGYAGFLEIGVKPANDVNPYTILAPRQPINSAPFAIGAKNALNATNATNAANAINATQLGGVAANQYVVTTDPRLSNTNNTSFIQNTTTQQASSNFNISGNGTLGGSLTANSITANSISGNGAGLTGVLSIYPLIGANVSLPANTSGYAFIGQTQTVILTANQRLTGAGSIPLATSSGTNVVSVGLCHKIGASAITNFAGGSSTNTIVDTTYKIYAASATVQPGAGQVQFGLCVGNNSQPLLSNNVNGWMMVTNN